jgi:hypothetical protein
MEYNIFVAGSKALQNERNVCRSVCNKLQNKWGTIITKTFEDFDETMSDVGHQKEYNNYIEQKADLVIFIFSGSVGMITRDEYDHAYRSFKASKRPKIIVYFDKKNSDNNDVAAFKKELGANDHYYQEYESLDELREKVEKHINNTLIAKNRKSKTMKKGKNKRMARTSASWGEILGVPAMFVGIWLLLGLIGGIVMYIVDCNMSDKTCKELAIRYVETLGNGVMYYNFPDETFVYDMNNKTLSIEPRNSELSSGNVNIGSIKDVTLASTTSLLLTRSFKFKPKGNAKTVATYVAGAACLIIGCGAGCIVEQMIFPPQYSDRVREYLMVEENWEYVIAAKAPTRIF